MRQSMFWDIMDGFHSLLYGYPEKGLPVTIHYFYMDRITNVHVYHS